MTDAEFSESVWGAGREKTRGFVMRLMSSRATSALVRLAVPLDRFVLKRSKGRLTALGPIGMPLLVLHTTGRKTGQKREQPLTYVRDGNRLVVVGTNFGQAHHPAWTANLLAMPQAEVTLGGRTVSVVATQLHGEEQQQFLRAFAKIGQNYAAYTDRTDRYIRVFALERTSD